MRRLATGTITLTGTFLALAAGATAACDSASDDEVFYCTTENGTIVDEDTCDANSAYGNNYFLWHARGRGVKGLLPGQQVPDGGQRFRYNDTAARTSWGLPATGVIPNGTIRSGIVGTGGHGSVKAGG